MSVPISGRSRVPLGQVYITRGAMSDLHEDDVFDALLRHMVGQWGDLDEQDWNANDEALAFGDRLLSAYADRRGNRFWIITEWDRSATTILLPDEY